jgi:hypothetical protein
MHVVLNTANGQTQEDHQMVLPGWYYHGQQLLKMVLPHWYYYGQQLLKMVSPGWYYYGQQALRMVKLDINFPVQN